MLRAYIEEEFKNKLRSVKIGKLSFQIESDTQVKSSSIIKCSELKATEFLIYLSTIYIDTEKEWE